ncbi:MAG: hypothetical protein ACREQW_17880 [Candidatus Binatia bacterium]
MTKALHYRTFGLVAAIVFLTLFVRAERTVAQQSASGPPSGDPKKPEAEATLYPVPDFSSDIWHRAKLTGDWFGLRNQMANNGIQLDVDNVHTFQSVSGGGLDSTSRYLGNAEIVLKLDSQKMGLWPGGFLLVRGEASFGTGVNAATGALLPVNTRPILWRLRAMKWCSRMWCSLNFCQKSLPSRSVNWTPAAATRMSLLMVGATRSS